MSRFLRDRMAAPRVGAGLGDGIHEGDCKRPDLFDATASLIRERECMLYRAVYGGLAAHVRGREEG